MPQKCVQLASPTAVTAISTTTATQDTHIRPATAATTGGVASRNPSPSRGQAPMTSPTRWSHRKSAPLSATFAHPMSTSAIVAVAPNQRLKAVAIAARAHHDARTMSAE